MPIYHKVRRRRWNGGGGREREGKAKREREGEGESAERGGEARERREGERRKGRGGRVVDGREGIVEGSRVEGGPLFLGPLLIVALAKPIDVVGFFNSFPKTKSSKYYVCVMCPIHGRMKL